MSENTRLLVHCGGVRRSRKRLAALHTPVGTATWKPIPHADLVSAIVEGLSCNDIEVTREEFCTMGRDDAKLLGTLDLRIRGLESPDFSMGLGLLDSNNNNVSISLVCACRVFVCDDWCFGGSAGAVFLKRKHTARLDIRAVVPGAIDQFLERAGAFRQDLDGMRDHRLTDDQAKAMIHDAFAARVMPLRLFPVVSGLYFEDRTQAEKEPVQPQPGLHRGRQAAEARTPAGERPQDRAAVRTADAPAGARADRGDRRYRDLRLINRGHKRGQGSPPSWRLAR